MEDIKILRLSCGEDIIGRVKFLDNGSLKIFDPMVFMLKDMGRSTNLLMQHWLPVNFLAKNEALLTPISIITICEPNEQFSEYYTNTIDKINSVAEPSEDNESLTEQEEIAILEALEEIRKESRIIH